jgi:membrane-bound lytic murein transglycosylase D
VLYLRFAGSETFHCRQVLKSFFTFKLCLLVLRLTAFLATAFLLSGAAFLPAKAQSPTAGKQLAFAKTPGSGDREKDFKGNDTVALPKALKSAEAKAALSAMGAAAKGPTELLKGKAFVPLAGHQEYFGAMTGYVEKFVFSYYATRIKTFLAVKARSKARFHAMDLVLQKHGIPKELKYLCVIESALNNKAISCVGALGPWQFMEETGRLMGLTVTEKRDDRTDWARSTVAAAKYLNQLYGKFHDWLLVVAAYNSGPTPIERAIAKTGSRNFWDIRKYLPRETQGHVLAFIATASVFEKLSHVIGNKIPGGYTFLPASAVAGVLEKKEPPKTQFTLEELQRMAIVRINEPISLEYLGQELGIARQQLTDWNEDYDVFLYTAAPEEKYNLRIPKDKLEAFIQKKDLLTKTSREIFAQNISN